MELVEVDVMRLGLDRGSNSYVVILQEKGGKRLLPIWIGQAEAESIVIEMSRMKRERPLTHDLCKNLILGLGGSLKRVHITKVQNRTFYAELHIAVDGGMVHIDARPSDSIAIALRFSAPIYAQVSGYVKMWHKDYGAQVKTGDILAEINAPALDAQYEQARADLEAEKAKYALEKEFA